MNTLNANAKIAVCSRSFSKNEKLREYLLSQFSNVKFNDLGEKLEGDSLVNFLHDCEGAIIALEHINTDILQRLPNLKVIGKYGVGLDKINLTDLKKHNVAIGWTPGVNKRSVAELTLAFMLMMLRRIPFAGHVAKFGPWHQVMGQDLTLKKIGIIGVGHVGKELITLLKPFRCQLLLNDIVNLQDYAQEHGAQICSKEEIYAKSDIITLHVPLTEKTNHMIGLAEFKMMNKGTILINAARGHIVDEKALEFALRENVISAAAFDVMAIEPPERQALFELENFFLTPHIGGSSREAILAMGIAAIDGLTHATIPQEGL